MKVKPEVVQGTSMSRDLQGSTITRVFRVWNIDSDAGAGSILHGAGWYRGQTITDEDGNPVVLPQLLDVHPKDSNYKAIGIDAVPAGNAGDSMNAFRLVVTYAWMPDRIYNFSSTTITEQVQRDLDGNALMVKFIPASVTKEDIANMTGAQYMDQFTRVGTYQLQRPVKIVTVSFQSSPLSPMHLQDRFLNHLNDSKWANGERGTWICSAIDGSEVFGGKVWNASGNLQRFFDITMVFQHNWIGWNPILFYNRDDLTIPAEATAELDEVKYPGNTTSLFPPEFIERFQGFPTGTDVDQTLGAIPNGVIRPLQYEFADWSGLVPSPEVYPSHNGF